MIVVAGHVCLDVIPAMDTEAALAPGTLVEVGDATFASGGAVANVGLALATLGLRPVLAGRIGDDPFGTILRDRLRAAVAGDADGDTLRGIVTAPGEATSYSVVISPRGRDRVFLHHSGCNDTFDPRDLQPEHVPGVSILHVGYPPLMRRTFVDGGTALRDAFARFRTAGAITSLDMAYPDPHGAAGRIAWRDYLVRVLPQTDLFLPSWSETLAMLRPAEAVPAPTPDAVAAVAEELLALGPALVGLKLGDHGLYVRTADDARCAGAGADGLPSDWAGRELWSPNFRVEIRGTTGAGDATIAGLLAALERRMPLEDALTLASASGASAVEGLDAVGAVAAPAELERRVADGWERAHTPADAWRRLEHSGILRGPRDGTGATRPY